MQCHLANAVNSIEPEIEKLKISVASLDRFKLSFHQLKHDKVLYYVVMYQDRYVLDFS